MKKALIKGAALWAFGNSGRGVRLYDYLTHEVLGTQSGWVHKYRRTWPDRLETLVALTKDTLEDKTVLIHEAGCSLVLACMNYLTCGNGGVLLNTDLGRGHLLDRHIVESINAALEIASVLDTHTPIPQSRIHRLDALRWRKDMADVLQQTNTRLLQGTPHGNLPLESNSIDMIHSGGSLEHYTPAQMQAWLAEAFRVLRPGGVIAPIIDHRDHLHHFDPSLPFLYHYQLSDTLYALTRPNPLLYHNRLLPREITAFFEAAGFRRIGVRRMTLPHSRYYEDGEKPQGDAGVERHRLAQRFRRASDDDLITAAAQYCFKKPEDTKAD